MKNLKSLYYEMVDLIKEEEHRELIEEISAHEADLEHPDGYYDDPDYEKQYAEDVKNGLFDDCQDGYDYGYQDDYEDDYGYDDGDDDSYHIMTAEDLKILEDMLGEI